MDVRALALDSLTRLDWWITQNGWAGYDPYDIKGLPALLYLQQRKRSSIGRLVKGVVWAGLELAPNASRRLLRVKKRVNAKAMGLFADGYLNLHQLSGSEDYLRKAQACLNWLEENPSAGYAGPCWGYPFDWQSRVFIPAGTPSAVVTSIVGKAYWNFYKHSGDRRFLSTCEGICEFFVNDLHIDDMGPEKICFSYTPVDQFHVHNANLFAAEFLVRVGIETGREDWVRRGLQAANYTLGEQNEDGSICYWGTDQESDCRIDHFHTGFEIRSLYSIWKLTRDDRILEAVSRYYQFYLRNLFVDRTIPRLRPHATYPINIHSCAEALLCNTVLADEFPEAREYVVNSLRWTLSNMQTEAGWFIFRIWRLGACELRSKIPHIRWGQAWMLNALSSALELVADSGDADAIAGSSSSTREEVR